MASRTFEISLLAQVQLLRLGDCLQQFLDDHPVVDAGIADEEVK